ncbi:MAG: glycoside hydrolase family 25 protein [Halocynthiibacter sp.]
MSAKNLSKLTRRNLLLAAPAVIVTSGLTPLGAAQAAAFGPRNFQDTDPVNFKGLKPHKFQIHGTDAARFQTEANWRTAKKNGVNFAWLKATEGGDLEDPMFRTHFRGARRAKVPVGAYHFYYFCTSPEKQAAWYIKNVRKKEGMLPPVLDMEWNPFSPTCTKRPSGRTVRNLARRFSNIITEHYGQRPVIYTTPGFYKDTGIGKFTDHEFWLRTTAKTPRQAYPGQNWRFWQYSSTGKIPGFNEEMDLNLFNGSATDWATWLARRSLT